MLHYHHYTNPHPAIQLSPRVGRCDNVLANLVNGSVVDTEYRVSTLEMEIVRVKHIYIYIYISPTIASHQRQELIVERMQSGKKLWRFFSFFLSFFFPHLRKKCSSLSAPLAEQQLHGKKLDQSFYWFFGILMNVSCLVLTVLFFSMKIKREIRR